MFSYSESMTIARK